MTQTSYDFDVLIVGSGLAGLSAALHLAPTHRVAVLTKRKVEQIEALMPDEFAYLFAVVVQVNADFFGQALPLIKAVARGLRSAAGPGPAAPVAPAPGTTTLPAAATS